MNGKFVVFAVLLLTASIAAGIAGGVSVGVAVFFGLLLLKIDTIIKVFNR